jgi:tRNA (guanine37-N1)-methyltransferase
MAAPVPIDVVTLFPAMIEQAAGYGVTGRAQERGLWRLAVWNPRDFTTDNHRTVDDRPYGGGPGMVLMPGPLAAAIAAARAAQKAAEASATRVIYLSPAGRPLTHAGVMELVAQVQNARTGLVLLAGRYEGVDQRLIAREVDDEIAVGDFVVSGGELPALMLIDAIARQLPGALNDEQSAQEESFATGLLDCPHYTRPEVYENDAVPPALVSGDHAAIRRWRLKEALGRTWQRRPELLAARALTREEATLLADYRREREGAAVAAEGFNTKGAHQESSCSARTANGQRMEGTKQ